MKTGPYEHKSLSEINVTPLVDVMLVLLIIFMITAPLMIQGIDVNLPQARAKALKADEKKLVLTIDKEKKIFIEKTQIPMDQLGEKLKAIFETRENREIFLRADKDVPYGFVVGTMAEIKNAGIEKLGMITEPYEE